jgi:hypothetical protein
VSGEWVISVIQPLAAEAASHQISGPFLARSTPSPGDP